MFIDSHCHIDGEQFDADRDEVVRRAKEAGVAAMLNIGTGDPHSDDFQRAVTVAEKYDNVFASVGVHPHDAKLYDDRAEQRLTELVHSSKKVIAWGEIGLDYYYDHSPREAQRSVFRRQLQIAGESRLPVIIHSREADDDTLEILTEEFGRSADTPVRMSVASTRKNISTRGTVESDTSIPVPGIMHCFGGTPQMAEELMKLGFLISFAGNVTFKKAENLREAAGVVPLDKLLVETDCPFLAPEPVRGIRNEPANVVHTARFLAEFKGVELAELAAATTRNFTKLFNVIV